MLLFVYVIKPTINQWQTVRENLSQAQSTLVSYEQKILEVQAKNRQLAKIYGDGVGKKLETIEDTKVSYVASLEQIVKNVGIQKPTIKAQPVRPMPGSKNLMLVGMRIQGQCKLSQALGCFVKLRELNDLVVIDQVQMSKSSKGGKLDISFIASRIARMK